MLSLKKGYTLTDIGISQLIAYCFFILILCLY
jgi:hypothetical protein